MRDPIFNIASLTPDGGRFSCGVMSKGRVGETGPDAANSRSLAEEFLD